MSFVSRLDSGPWAERIRRFRHNIVRTVADPGTEEDRLEMQREILRSNPAVVVTDSAAIDEEYLAYLSNRVPLVVGLDDAAAIRFPCDLVLNPSLGRTAAEYAVYPGTQIVGGHRYAMIRSEFRRARNVRATEPGGPTRILISLGAGAVARPTARLAQALLEAKVCEKIDAVLGCTPTDRDDLSELQNRFPNQVTVTVDARDLGSRMSKSHLLICGGGNTALEAACVGVPMLVATTRDDYLPNAQWLEESGAAQIVGAAATVDPKAVAAAAAAILGDNFERKAMSRSGRILIDGRGADRMVTATEILLRRSRRVKSLAA
ncbi:MAG: hypothetical protein ACRC1K_00880 [Planctomycetia bacterium]